MLQVALHEIFHILGFSQNLFDKFQECSICGKFELNIHSFISQYIIFIGKLLQLLVTPQNNVSAFSGQVLVNVVVTLDTNI